MLLILFLLFTLMFAAFHLPLLKLPYFWDEHGQFIPTALDLLRDGAWVAHSTLPNIHPPGVEAYLVLWYKVFGYSILVTRIAMLMLAGLGLLGTFLLAIELSTKATGAPAFVPRTPRPPKRAGLSQRTAAPTSCQPWPACQAAPSFPA